MEVANAAIDMWHAEMPGKLKIVTGTTVYAQSVTFYTPDSPSHLIEFNYAASPWITPERVKREGMLIVCTAEDLWCRTQAEKLITPASKQIVRRFTKSLYGLSASEYEFVFTLIPGQA
jgi:hypothetical protein